MAYCFVNAQKQLTVNAFWFWLVRIYGHVAVRSSPATYELIFKRELMRDGYDFSKGNAVGYIALM